MTSGLFAASFPDADVIAAFVVPIGMFSVPIIAILTRHQHRMAQIIHGRRQDDVLRAELEAVKGEVAELRSQLRSLHAPASTAPAAEDLRHRLG